MTDQQLADKWIKEMQEAGLTPDQMLKVIRMVRERFEEMKANESELRFYK